MIDIEAYIAQLKDALLRQFGARLVYMGLQGSYLRGEANEHSDIDIMIVLDALSVADLDAYHGIVKSMDYAHLSCGFICSTEDMGHWNPLEIWNLVNGTKDFHGKLTSLVPAYTEEDVRNYVKMSLNNLYHAVCHTRIHGGRDASMASLPAIYKGVFFILQGMHYLRSGRYIATKAELLEHLEGTDRDVMERSLELSRGIAHDYDNSFLTLFSWCQDAMKSI